jgi:transcriptional regulator GlxA family with amidase domain
MKNPGLKPFQLEGVPLQMRVPPGESPYLNQIAVSGKENKKYTQACQLFRENPEMKHSEIAKLVQVSPTTISHYFKKYKGQEELNLSDENL